MSCKKVFVIRYTNLAFIAPTLKDLRQCEYALEQYDDDFKKSGYDIIELIDDIGIEFEHEENVQLGLNYDFAQGSFDDSIESASKISEIKFTQV